MLSVIKFKYNILEQQDQKKNKQTPCPLPPIHLELFFFLG